MTDNQSKLTDEQRSRFVKIVGRAAASAAEFTLDPRTPHVAFADFAGHCLYLSVRIAKSRTDFTHPVRRWENFFYVGKADEVLDRMQAGQIEFDAACAALIADAQT